MIIFWFLVIIWILKFCVFKCCRHCLKSLIRARPSSSTIISKVAVSPSSSSPWDRLPSDVTSIVFANLCIADRVRMRLVCKSWKEKLMREDIPVAPEAPWLIVSKDSYSNVEYSLDEICLQDNDERIYRFKLPSSGQWWCCGSSRGWLVMAGKDWNRSLEEAEIMLWNPISGAIQELPALSTLPFLDRFINDGYANGIESISRFIKRVEVFSEAEYCGVNVVAVVFENPAEYPRSALAVCTPHDLSWSVAVGEYEHVHISAICFHNRQLYASCWIVGQGDQGVLLAEKYTITLESSRDMEVIVLQLIYEREIEPTLFTEGFSFWERAEVVEHLVESSCSGELLAVTAILGRWLYYDRGNHGPIESFCCSQTTKFEVRRVLSAEGDCCLESSIGDEAIFVGSKSSLSIEAASVDGIEANCIYYATADAKARRCEDLTLARFYAPDKDYHIREQGVYSMPENRIEIISHTNIPSISGSTTGWFTPKLF